MKQRLSRLLIGLALCAPLWATTTTVTQTLVGPDGNPASGNAAIHITAACSYAGSYVGDKTITVKFSPSGSPAVTTFTVALVPNVAADGTINGSGGCAGTSYTVSWNFTGGVQLPSETWVVPVSPTPVSIDAVKTGPVAPPTTTINPSQISTAGGTVGQTMCLTTSGWAPGSCGFVWEGAWSASVPYIADNVVSYLGSSYIALQGSTNVLPTNPTYWSLVVGGCGGLVTWGELEAGGCVAAATGAIVAVGYGFGNPIVGGNAYLTIPFGGVIHSYDMMLNQGAATVDVWRVATGQPNPTIADSITGSATPSITGPTPVHSTTLTGWQTTINAGDVLAFSPLVLSGGLASGSYNSGITATGSTGQTCALAGFNGGGSSAAASVALTGTNAIAAGAPLTVTSAGTTYTSAPTTATVGNGTATCSGTASVSTAIAVPTSMTIELEVQR